MIYSVCPQCEIEYKPETIGVYVIELCHDDKDVYRIWVGDLHKCPGCGNEIVGSKNMAKEPLWASYDNKIKDHGQEEREIDGWDYVERIRERGGTVIICRERLKDGDGG